MIICPNCNKQLEDGTKFCDNCGTKIMETIFCPNCGKQMSTQFDFCDNCGTPLFDSAISSDKTEKEEIILPKKTVKISKKLIAIGSACFAVALVAVIILISLLSGGNENSNNFTLYLKDGEMYFTDILKIKPWQVTTRLIDDDSIDDDDVAYLEYDLADFTQLSNDGKILFYADRMDLDSASLFYRYVNKPEQEPAKIDSDVVCYSVSESGKTVTYIKGEEGVLYQHNLIEKEKIDSDVNIFEVSDDGKKIVYLNKEGGMYAKYAGKEKEKLDSDVSSISYINNDFDTIYYVKDDSLYRKAEGKEREKISSDISSVIRVYETGEVYYLKGDSSEITLLDYVKDDMKDTDAAMTEPEYPEYPSYWDYFGASDDYQAAIERYEREYEEYETARDAWYAKQERDELREDLAGQTMSNNSYSLCYYNGKEEKVLTDAFVNNYGDYTANYNNPIIVFHAYNQSDVKKVKLSEIDYAYEVEEMVDAALYSSSEVYIAIQDSTSIIEQNEAEDFRITYDGKTVYYLDDVSEESYHGDVYKISISGNKANKPELYDTDVYSNYSMFVLSNGKLLYFKDVKDGDNGELYIDKQMIDYDVWTGNYAYLEESDAVVYMTDWNSDKSYGTLKMSKGGKATKIADDVYTFDTTPNDEIQYLYDYSTKYHKGGLFLYKNGKAEKIDDDVVAIVPIYDLKYRGDGYYAGDAF